MKPFFEHQLDADLIRLKYHVKPDVRAVYDGVVFASDNHADKTAGCRIAYVVSYLSQYVDLLTNASRFSDAQFWIASAENKLEEILEACETLRQTRSTWNDTRLMLAEIRIDQLRRIILELKRLEKHMDSVKV